MLGSFRIREVRVRGGLERRSVETLAGRRAELDRLHAFALGDESLVMHIQGIPLSVAQNHEPCLDA